MAETTIGIINGALYKLGERAITSLGEDTPQAHAMKDLHAQAFRYVISKYAWSAATETRSLLSDAQYAGTPRWQYRFALPNKLVKLLNVYDSDEDRYYNFRRRGNFIYTDISAILIEYTEDITASARIDSLLAEVLVCYLAYLAAPRLTKEEETAQRMYQEYMHALREAKTADSQQKGPLFYGPDTPIQGDPYNDHPNGWADR